MDGSIFDAAQPRFIGHRGFTPLAPENSLPSFKAAGKHGLWAIETDVHLTRDGVLVCCHNADTGGWFNGASAIAETDFSELRKLRFIRGNRVEFLSPEELRIPTFAEYLEICLRYNAVPFVESKVITAVEPVLAELERFGLLRHSVLSSVEFSHIEECRRLNREIFVHHIFSTPEIMLKIAGFGNGGLSYNYPDPADAPPEWIREAHRNGVRVCLRAGDTPEQVRKMMALELDYIPTNRLWSL